MTLVNSGNSSLFIHYQAIIYKTLVWSRLTEKYNWQHKICNLNLKDFLQHEVIYNAIGDIASITVLVGLCVSYMYQNKNTVHFTCGWFWVLLCVWAICINFPPPPSNRLSTCNLYHHLLENVLGTFSGPYVQVVLYLRSSCYVHILKSRYSRACTWVETYRGCQKIIIIQVI